MSSRPPSSASLDELKEKYLGDHALDCVLIDENVDAQVVELVEKTRRRWLKSQNDERKKAKNEVAAAAAATPKANESERKKRLLSSSSQPSTSTRERKTRASVVASPSQPSTYNAKPKTPVASKSKPSPAAAKPKTRASALAASSQPSISSVKPKTRTPTLSSSSEPSTSFAKPKTPAPAPPKRKSTSFLESDIPRAAVLPFKRIPRLPKPNCNLSTATDALLDLAGKSLSTPKTPQKRLKEKREKKEERNNDGHEAKKRKEYVNPRKKPMAFMNSVHESPPNEKTPECSCFANNAKEAFSYEPFICTQDLEDVGMTIIKIGRESLDIDLKFSEDAYCDPEYFKLRVPDISSIGDYISKKTAFENIANANNAVEFLLVFFWETPDNDPNTIRRLYHSLKCKNSVGVVEGLDKESPYCTYLLPYIDHDSLPETMTSRKLNFIGAKKDQPAFIFVVLDKPKPVDTQSSAVSSTSVVPGELGDLPISALNDQSLDWRRGLLTVEDLVTMCIACTKNERVREYIDYFVEANPEAELQYSVRSALLRGVKNSELLSADSQRWLQLRNAPPVRIVVDREIESAFYKSLRPCFVPYA